MQNSVVWSEIAVADLKRAAAFYEKLLDTELAFDKFGPFRIALFPHGEQGVGGCLVHGEGYEPSGETREDWRNFRVDRIAALAALERRYPDQPGRRLADFLDAMRAS
jgi:predicted enzyme related to lactoylglutathione lyase